MNILVIGGGGREHAIIKKLREDPRAERIFALPGNGGIAADAECAGVSATDIPGILAFARANAVDFAVVAPDDPLVLGAVDALEEAGIPCFGPRKNAAIIEGSKVFSKNLMEKYHIPTAACRIFDAPGEALAYVDECPLPAVVKADGLALGKGVLICETRESAREAVCSIMEDRIFGDPRSPCWPSPTGIASSPWSPPWTTSGPWTGTGASTPAAWEPWPPTPATRRRWRRGAWRRSSCPPSGP